MYRNPSYAVQVLAVLCIAALLTAGWWYWGSFTTAALYFTLTCCAIIIFGLLIYASRWYFLALVGLIPISLDAALFGGAKLNLPAEGLLLGGILVWLYFNRSYLNGFRTVIRHPIVVLFGLLFLTELFSGLLSNYIDVSLKRLFIHVLFFLGFFVTIQSFRTAKELREPFLAYAVGLVPVMILTLITHAHYNFAPQAVFSICQPFYNDHTVYGACMAFVIPLLFILIAGYREMDLTKRKRFWLILLTVLILVSEVLALSRAALLSLIVAVFFYLLLRYRVTFRNLLLGIVGLLALVWVFSNDIYSAVERNESVSNDGELVNHFSSVANVKNDASNLERINRWICAFRMFEEHPVLGFGPGTYQFEYNRYQTLSNKTYISTNLGDRGNAHSEYLAFLSESGIIGFVLFLAIVLLSLHYGMQNHYALKDGFLRRLNLGVLLGLVSYYFHGIFNSFLDQSKLAFLFFTALGIIVWINLRLKDETSDQHI